MKVHRASVMNYMEKGRYRYLASFIRLKLHFKNGYTKKYTLPYIASILGCSKTTASRTMTFLKKHKFVTFDEGKVMRLTNLYSNEKNQKLSLFDKVYFNQSMTDEEIHGHLCAINLENIYAQQRYIRNLKHDRNQVITSKFGKSKMFASLDTLQRKYKRYANKDGFRAETVDEFRLSDTKAAQHFKVSVNYYRRKIIPRVKNSGKIKVNTVLRIVKGYERGTNKITSDSCFVSRNRLVTCYREYDFRAKFLEKIDKREISCMGAAKPLTTYKYSRRIKEKTLPIEVPKEIPTCIPKLNPERGSLVVVGLLRNSKILDFQTDL